MDDAIGLADKYAAVFENIRSFIVGIGPQILFSIALTLITSAASWMMYKSNAFAATTDGVEE